MANVQRITTCLWYDANAEEAVNFYVSLFPGSRVVSVKRYGKGAPMPEGLALVIDFELFGVRLMTVNGGPIFPHSEAASLVVDCDTQDEIDRYWSALIADGGAEQRCGWLKDRFGLSWQIVPGRLREIMAGDHAAGERALAAIMGMVKLDIAAIEAAARG